MIAFVKKRLRSLGLLNISLLILGLVVLGALAWQQLRPQGLGEGFAQGNGRIEATEIDIATKQPGRVAEILVGEGEFVQAGQLLARMDDANLRAQLAQAEAQVHQAENSIRTAQALVAMRESEKATAAAVVHQRQAEYSAAAKRHQRTETLVARNAMARQQLDDDLARKQSSQAAVAAARAQELSADAAITAARSQVIEAESALDAAKASVTRIQSDLSDSLLKSDRLARVQYLVAQPGEVLGGGGKVLNLVDLTDVYMTFFLPTREAGRVALGSEVRLVMDVAPQYVIPAEVSYVASTAQFTPKTVETASEREKLMFRVKARIDPKLLQRHLQQVKTGLPGTAYLKLDDNAAWPAFLEFKSIP